MEEINLELTPRSEGTIERSNNPVIKFKSDEILDHFRENVEAIKAQFIVADELVAAGRREEAENVWRSQIIFLDSAFDFYLHELTKYGLCEIFTENWARTDKYNNIQMKMGDIHEGFNLGASVEWFLEFINNYYKEITMASFDSVKKQMSLLGIDIGEVSKTAFYERGSDEKPQSKLKRRLNELYARRNKIAHQSDREHTDASKREISKDIVSSFVSDIEKIVNGINEEVIRK